MATAAISSAEFVELISSEMSRATRCAVEAWLAEIDATLNATALSHADRLRAAEAVIERYKQQTGKPVLQPRADGAEVQVQ
jgi:hypothetical protein